MWLTGHILSVPANSACAYSECILCAQLLRLSLTGGANTSSCPTTKSQQQQRPQQIKQNKQTNKQTNKHTQKKRKEEDKIKENEKPTTRNYTTSPHDA
ncbi:Hypothetical protein, putative [Bodo saltans]|uniref:Secreted protein n=1 Tax=Bodo saltans TaxID=75058 RepID=A0A0S4JYV3_BODSA|nr:Hypothetical protein, putative [Bodo saltans]|eukprot:CUG93774.1 Hypothetical protein, putative [Bodo saltans]